MRILFLLRGLSDVYLFTYDIKLKYLTPEFEIEQISNNKYSRVVGIDEVGRGCWAGPVCLGIYEYHISDDFIKGINDSKLLSIKNRQTAYASLKGRQYQVAYGSVEDIDRDGLGNTLNRIITEKVNAYDDDETLILLDGHFAMKFSKNVQMIKKGDSKFYSIAAASIVAKVERDRLLEDLSIEYNMYGFEKHKGYGTKQHREALNQYGICPIHRTSFKPVQEIIRKNH